MKNNSFNKEEIILISIFAAIWAAFEIVVGNALHLAKIPFRGTLLTLVAAVILITAGGFVNKKGSLILMGAVTASLKAASAGGIVLTPMIAIFLEAVLAEIVFASLKRNLFSCIIAGVSIMFYTLSHSIIAQLFIFGIDLVGLYKHFALEFSNLLGFGEDAIYLPIILYVMIYISGGILSGIIGYKITIQVKLKLSRAEARE